MFGHIKIDGNERVIAREYVNRIDGNAQLQQVLEVLLNGESEDLEALKAEHAALENDYQQLQENYDDLHARWVAIGGDLL